MGRGMGGGPKPRPAIDRFAAMIALTDGGCWEWLGFLNAGGYARFTPGGRNRGRVYAHRWSYEQFMGPIPEGMHLDHLCRVRACVNPEHLEPVTPAENVRRGTRLITHCPQGHPYSGSNVRYVPGTEQRVCRTCKRDRSNARPQTRAVALVAERRNEMEKSF